MNRFELNNLKAKRKRIHNTSSKPSLTRTEVDANTFSKFVNGELYTSEDIEKIAKHLFTYYQYDYQHQFRLLSNIENFDTCFEDVKIETDKPVFVVYAKQKNYWVLFCLVRYENKQFLLYKDPCGSLISYKLEKKILEKFSNMEFRVQTTQDQRVEDEESYGPLTVRNLRTVLEKFRTNPNFVEMFENEKFATINDINSERLINISDLTTDLSKNEEFKQALKNFIDKLPTEFGAQVLDYRKVLENELNKEGENVDHARILEARNKFLNEEDIKKLREDYELNAKKEENRIEDYELNIQKKFPTEMKKLRKIFEILSFAKTDDELYTALRTICDILNIDYQKIRVLYEFQTRKPEIQEKTLESGNMDEVLKNLPEPKKLKREKSTPLEMLLQNTVVGQDKDLLKDKFSTVKQKYELWKGATVGDINTWAKSVKGHLGTGKETICEAIAIMDRAFNLLTTWRLRDPQILALLIFLDSKTQGCLSQIQTGEGKTIIVSFLAIIKVLQGLKVDVITSNAILATEGLKECKNYYTTFGLTAATNNPEVQTDYKISYTADVLYGTISNFQFDYLKDTFEGYNIRRNRSFGQVILDEVDSMLIDNGGHIAKLAEPFPGMEYLRYVYIKIWEELIVAEEKFVEETQRTVEESLMKTEHAEVIRQDVFDIINSEDRVIMDTVKNNVKLEDFVLIPNHLKSYVESKLDRWIRNAIFAKNSCLEHQPYRTITDSSGEKIIVPVDYLNTGVTLRNTIWSNGLHQFVQLKHNVRLTFESLTSSFISNIGYIKKYNDANIFGMTGTLGSQPEQKLLSHIYNVNYAKIPTYKPKSFRELDSLIEEDDLWSSTLAIEILKKIEEKRAVLVIAETEQDIITLKEEFENLGTEASFRIRIYVNEENAMETKEKVKIGDIILATNIAGRGTNFKTEKSLEANGGLHVCVGFLPYNLRVEEQAFGRTSRQGNKGTANLIIRRSEMEELGELESNNFDSIKEARNSLESNRLEQIDKVLVQEIVFKDKLFDIFADFQKRWKQEHRKTKSKFVLRDLREFWAFWLDRKNFSIKNIVNTTPRQEFDNFVKEADAIVSGNIKHNPFYCISLAAHYLEEDRLKEASEILEVAKRISNDTDELLIGEHLKLFQIAVLNGGQVLQRFKKAMAALFFIHVEKNEEYKKHAVRYLTKAKAALEKEINYIDNHLSEKNPNFQKILTTSIKENYFLKHINSRLYILKFHTANIVDLIKTLENETEGLDLEGVAVTSTKAFSEISSKSDNYITHFELRELHLIGVDALYSLKRVYDVPSDVISAIQGQIMGGIAALAVGLCFPPVLPIMGPIAGTLISEGIIDLIFEILINTGSTEFDKKDFIKNKIVTYAISIITFGISAIAQSVKILKSAVKLFRKLSSFLKKSTHFKGVANKLAKVVDKLGDFFENALELAKFKKLTKSAQLNELKYLKGNNLEKFEHFGGLKKLKELQHLQQTGKLVEARRLQLLKDVTEKITFESLSKGGRRITEEKILKPLVRMAVYKFVEGLREDIIKSLKGRETVMKKLQTAPRDKITEVVDNFVDTDVSKAASEKIALELFSKLDNNYVDAAILFYQLYRKGKELDYYVNFFAKYIDRNLEEGSAFNDVDSMINKVTSKVVEQLHSTLYDLFDAIKAYPKSLFKRYAVPALKKRIFPSEGDDELGSTSQDMVPDKPTTPMTDVVKKSFATLGLDESSSKDEVRRKYLSAVRDKTSNNDTDDLAEVNVAYSTINKWFEGDVQTENGTVIIGREDGTLSVEGNLQIEKTSGTVGTEDATPSVEGKDEVENPRIIVATEDGTLLIENE